MVKKMMNGWHWNVVSPIHYTLKIGDLDIKVQRFNSGWCISYVQLLSNGKWEASVTQGLASLKEAVSAIEIYRVED